MEDLHSFKFPQTSEQLKSGELESLINGLTLIEDIVNSLESKFDDGQNDKGSSMLDRILKEKKKKKKKKKETILKQWLCNVTWDEEFKQDSKEE